ncbi:hypothetical protein B9Z55_010748 [Caenorhabditis nigoni]|nr:hypothetical protein B9Z55_010748 [Caenorhabditis nigoni]
MWKKSLSAYKKVDEVADKDNSNQQHSFNYQKLTDSETMPKPQNKGNRKSSSYSHSSTTSTSSSSTCPSAKRYTSSQQSFAFVPPIFPVVPQKFVFFG